MNSATKVLLFVKRHNKVRLFFGFIASENPRNTYKERG